jgi:hypothetical protein
MEDAVVRGWAGGRRGVGRTGGTRRVERAVRGRSVRRVGHTGTQGVRARGGTPSSVGRLDRWVQVMDRSALYIYINLQCHLNNFISYV